MGYGKKIAILVIFVFVIIVGMLLYKKNIIKNGITNKDNMSEQYNIDSSGLNINYGNRALSNDKNIKGADF